MTDCKNVERALQGKVFELPCYSGKRGKMRFRNPDSVAEMIAHCSANSHVWVKTRFGDARQVKINGAVRTWKRDANRVEVPYKYGMREYDTLYASDISMVLIPVE